MDKQNCRSCSQPFTVTDSDQVFYKRINVPQPTLCPDCRFQRRMAFRNETRLYNRKCDYSGKDIISIYSPDKPYKVYDQNIWWSDKWDPLEYGQDYDFNKSFFEQFKELQLKVPRESLVNFNCENCEYNNMVRNSKNCYLCSLVADCEELYYCYWMVDKSYRLFDCAYGFKSQSSYECLNIDNCYNCIYLHESTNSQDCLFSYDLTGCDNCIFCSNLRNKKYYIRNKQASKEEYEELKQKITGSYKAFMEAENEFKKVCQNAIRRNVFTLQVENCTGDYLRRCKNCQDCFDIENGEDLKYCISVGNSKDCMDGYALGFQQTELTYECSVVRGNYHLLFCFNVKNCNDLFYCDSCANSKNLFGCIGLRANEYCILNKQYSKEDYEKLVPKIIEHMRKTEEYGEFFPPQISAFGYNETVAIEHCPLTKEQALDKNYKWSDFEQSLFKTNKIISADKLPDNINEVTDEILETAVECEVTKKPFRIIKEELEFYRKNKIPLPRKHPQQRLRERLAFRNPRRIWERNCDNCGKKMITSYNPERKEKIYCEDCYKEYVY